MKVVAFPLAALGFLVACDRAPPRIDTEAVVETINSTAADIVDKVTLPATDAWIGKWVGVEGLVLDIVKGEKPDTYALAVTLLDGTNSYVGTARGDTIVFARDGKEAVIRKASGDETGLKYLAGKKNCLMIQPGEGFCRD